MSSLNVASRRSSLKTHEGGKSPKISPLQRLRRSVMTCLLWEPTAYESGATVAGRIADLVTQCRPGDVADLAIEARNKMQLRHVPLFLVRELARVKGNGPYVERALRDVIQRPDEMTEYLTLWFRDGRKPISAASKRALRFAFGTFDRHTLAKYKEQDKGVKLVDVLRIVRPKPLYLEQSETYRRLRKGELVSTETWESELSAGKDKKATFERLLTEKKLGALATLRNLRNMQQAKVSDDLIRQRLSEKMDRAWPYRFVVAAKYAPNLEDALEGAMFRAAESIEPLPGKTGLLVDVSGSMTNAPSSGTRKGQDPTTCMDLAAGLAIILREKAAGVRVATFSSTVVTLPPRRGFALRDAIVQSQPHNSTELQAALRTLKDRVDGWADLDRVIVITDEQSSDGILDAWTEHAYVINVAANAQGVGNHSGWHKINGWSERVLDYIASVEADERA